MAVPALSEIEREFASLTPEAQLTLLERLVHRLRVAASGNPEAWEADLAAMATDVEVQRELQHIHAEFAAD
jgi:hypothetical protein